MRKHETTWDGEAKAVHPYHSLIQAMGLYDEDSEDAIPIQYTGIQGTVALAFALGNLTDREQTVMTMRFVDGMTYEECGKHFGVTRERIRQVEAKATRKLRGRKSIRELMQMGIASYWQKCIDEEAERVAQKVIEGYRWALDREYEKKIEEKCHELEIDPETVLVKERKAVMNTPIENLDLSVRSYNCLHRANIKTIEELTSLSWEQLISIRNLGRKSAEEVCDKLHSMGLGLAPGEEAVL